MDKQEDHGSTGAQASGGRGPGRYFWFWGLLWTLLVAGLLINDILHIRERTWKLAFAEARVHLDKDMAARLWATSHGGVYVPVTQTTPANPYLIHVPERDIQTPGGATLTLMNPAYMLRQMMEHYASLYGARGHITSLKHFREETAPDEWERMALLSFTRGMEEVFEVSDIGGRSHFRLMRPLHTEEACLKCHGFQGYREGDVRGGVSISVPMERYLEKERAEMLSHSLSFAILWAVGATAIGFTAHSLMRRTRERDRAEDLLRRSEGKYSSLVANSLTGIYVNLDGRIVFANPKLGQMFGYGVEELTGMDYLALIHPEDRATVAEYRDRRLRGLEAPAEYEVHGLTKGGHTFWITKRNTLTEYEGRRAVLANVEDVSERKRSAEELEKSERMLRSLSARLLCAHEEERKRIAYEIHEGLAQTLSAAKFRMESILAGLKGQETLSAIRTLEPTVDIMRESIAMVRQIAHRLRPTMLDELGILPAFAWLCRQVSTEHPGLAIESRAEVEERQIPEPLKVEIYRVLERALHGIAGQGDADLVEVSMRREGVWLVLSVWENGTGLWAEDAGTPEKEVPGRTDLASIRERCMLSGARLSVRPHEGGGTTMTVRWPLDNA